jgi:hypothetical protein
VRNKRGSLPVVVLVALTLVLTISTLVIFYLNAGKASAQISSVGFVEGMYVQEDLAKYYIYVVGKELIQNNSLTKDNFISEFSKFSFKEDYLIALQKIVATGNFTITQDSFELGKELFWLVSADENTVVKYTSRLNVNFSN